MNRHIAAIALLATLLTAHAAAQSGRPAPEPQTVLPRPPAPVATAPEATAAPTPAPAVPSDAEAPAPGHDNGETLWPQTATVDGVTWVLYTPQFQSIDGSRASCRAAFSTQRASAGSDHPDLSFGALFFHADLDSDASAGLLEVSNLVVEQAKPSDGGDGTAAATQLQAMLSGVRFTVERSIVMQNMQVAKDQGATRASLNNAPPKIRVVDHAATLLLLDGKPVLRDVGGGVGLAQNTPSLLAFEKTTRTWFTRVGTDTWMHSSRFTGPYIPGKTPSPDALKAIAAALPKTHPDAANPPKVPAGKEPEIVVSTSPMCLVSINGQPALTAVADGLSAVSNANCDLFTTAADGAWWLLASGRWFTTTNLKLGPWTYVKASNLPAAFSQIDPHGTWGNVLSCVTGTPQATDALYQQSVPHVATLDRALAKPKLSTLGGPARFKAIEGTDMQYATNTSAPMILCKGTYYLCEGAAWFSAPAANGPWTLCDSVPEEIYTIPPSCPVYNATYVQVYNSAPDAVTYGYTAGYMNSYENDGTVAYGTGYAYPGSVGHHDLGSQDLVLGDNSDVTDDDTWDSYGGWPNTYGYWPSYGGYYGGWGFYGYPGWGGYGLWCGPYWGAGGWWGGGRGFGTGFALGMGFANSWNWGYHPWGWRDGNGWWNNHWGGAYRRGWDNAARGYNRAGAAADMNAYARGAGGGMAAAQTAEGRVPGLTAGTGETRVPGTTAGTGETRVPGMTTGSGAWRHAAGMMDNVGTNRDGQVVQQRGNQTYARSNGAWQRTTESATAGSTARAPARGADGSWRDGAATAHARSAGGSFQERDGSASAGIAARGATMDGFRPDPNHNFDGSPRGGFARGETNYADRGAQAWGPNDGGRSPSTYQRGGSWNGGGWNGGGWGVGDQGGTAAQRYGNDYDRGVRGFNQDTGWYDRTASRPANPYGYGYSGWSNGYRGMSPASNWGGARGGVRMGGGMRGGGGGRR